MIIDFRFHEIPYDMMLLRQHIELVRRQHESMVEREVARLWEGVGSIEDDEEWQFASSDASHLEDRLREGITTRFLALSALVAVWANYEAAVKEAAAYVAGKREISLQLSQIRGSFLEQARIYFPDVLKMDLHPIETDIERLREISVIRNAVAHANGRITDLNASGRSRVLAIAASRPGVRVEERDWIILSFDYVLEAHNFVEQLVMELFERIRRMFPSRGAV